MRDMVCRGVLVPETEARGHVRFVHTQVEGVVIVDIDRIDDDRGFFARTWCEREFADNGIDVTFVQENIGFNMRAGTLRGLHFQRHPFEELKLVRCSAGSIWDLAVDLRTESPSYLQSVSVELTAESRRMLIVPEGCAHGYLTLTDGAEVTYLTSTFYEPRAAAGVRYDDPLLKLDWPSDVSVLSDADRSWPLLTHGQAVIRA